jgi:hypothetical protein
MAKKRVGILTGGGELYDSFMTASRIGDHYEHWRTTPSMAFEPLRGDGGQHRLDVLAPRFVLRR